MAKRLVLDYESGRVLYDGAQVLTDETVIPEELPEQDLKDILDSCMAIWKENLLGEKQSEGTLASLIDLEPSLERETVLSIFTQLVHMLCTMEEKGICHRDLKLENILYKRSEGGKGVTIAIRHFVLSATKDEEESLRNVCGTEGYFPPEQIKHYLALKDAEDAFHNAQQYYFLREHSWEEATKEQEKQSRLHYLAHSEFKNSESALKSAQSAMLQANSESLNHSLLISDFLKDKALERLEESKQWLIEAEEEFAAATERLQAAEKKLERSEEELMFVTSRLEESEEALLKAHEDMANLDPMKYDVFALGVIMHWLYHKEAPSWWNKDLEQIDLAEEAYYYMEPNEKDPVAHLIWQLLQPYNERLSIYDVRESLENLDR